MAARGKLVPSTARSRTSVRSSGGRPSRRATSRAVRVAGHLEVVERAHETWPEAVGLHQAAVDERSDDLDGVEGDALGLADDVLGHVGGEVDQVVEEPEHRRAVEGVEADAGAVAALPPPRSALGQLGSGQRQDEDGVGRRPVEDRVEEVEQPGVGPLEVVDHHDDRMASP